jgi:hypothetical protein
MMCHEPLHGASFWSFLLTVDRDLAKRTQQDACPCGGRLHCAHYARKPRGLPSDLPEEHRLRLSFCCNRDGCRRRVTPPSVRFLGRKVHLAAIVILIAAMQQGPTPRRVRELSKLIGADRTTLWRWQVFWREHVPQTPFWKVACGRLVPVAGVAILPRSLVEAFLRGDDPSSGVVNLLRFLSPITTAGVGLRMIPK